MSKLEALLVIAGDLRTNRKPSLASYRRVKKALIALQLSEEQLNMALHWPFEYHADAKGTPYGWLQIKLEAK